MKSIRQYLLLGLFGTLLLSSCASFLISYISTTEEIGELHDAQLIENSRFIEGFLNQKPHKLNIEQINQALSQVKATHLEEGEDFNADTHAYERKVAIQVWDKHGKLLLSTPSAPDHALSPLQKGFFQHKTGKHTWYIYTHQIPANQYWLMVAERSDIREEMLHNILFSMLSGTIIAIVMIMILIGNVIKRGLLPLTQLSTAMQERDLDYLQPVKLTNMPPNELKPVLHALNHLLDRLDEGIERERRFLADAAHELRTPLSVLKLQLELASQSLTLEQKQQGIEDALMGVNRSTHTVEQLLTLARLEANKQALQRDAIDLVSLVQEVTAALYPLAQPKEQNLELDYQQDAMTLKANRVLMNVLVRNLIENAIKYSPSNSTIHIFLGQKSNQVCLEVCDQGQGVPEGRAGRHQRRQL
ncbi:MAG TPA: histidine kinase dimerization/phospho-acceptor domain-containing protein, partial [Agitococcus sp.]|nr:histidine kinase dimerization/phospho-acceptor domain-containing protein [Agitococcus sp.]